MSVPLDPAGDPDRYDPSRDTAAQEPAVEDTAPLGPGGVLDMSQDPDRYDAARDDVLFGSPRLDPALDPDRFSSPTLPGLLGDGANEEPRDTYQWLVGLLGVLLFLGLVAFVATQLGPP